ncbi:hypothetical protein SAMN05660297_02783 [Natronincola peptidivorans]|uniref:Uncharacterized protein n=1 Tax=Natronincola peptidivorans TaxID=426128 RepID=A0A1I0FEU3_9FIRM|nr:hypothetical protein [Natronincola peptidivorans]SET56435.1 hypothetical protein SAMN05660297_02783 [Natronincola peptidivorans]
MSLQSKFSLTSEDKAILTESLKLFIANEIEDIPQQHKLDINKVAFNIIAILNNKDSNFTENQYLIMYNALDYFKDNVSDVNTSDININADSIRFNEIISRLMNTIDRCIG